MKSFSKELGSFISVAALGACVFSGNSSYALETGVLSQGASPSGFEFSYKGNHDPFVLDAGVRSYIVQGRDVIAVRDQSKSGRQRYLVDRPFDVQKPFCELFVDHAVKKDTNGTVVSKGSLHRVQNVHGAMVTPGLGSLGDYVWKSSLDQEERALIGEAHALAGVDFHSEASIFEPGGVFSFMLCTSIGHEPRRADVQAATGEYFEQHHAIEAQASRDGKALDENISKAMAAQSDAMKVQAGRQGLLVPKWLVE